MWQSYRRWELKTLFAGQAQEQVERHGVKLIAMAVRALQGSASAVRLGLGPWFQREIVVEAMPNAHP